MLADIEITLTCNEASWKKCKKKKNSLLQERRRLELNKRASEAKIGKVAVIKCVKDTENLESSLMYILEEMTKLAELKLRVRRSYLDGVLQHLYPLDVSCGLTSSTHQQMINVESQ